jgi:hypothetical protein
VPAVAGAAASKPNGAPRVDAPPGRRQFPGTPLDGETERAVVLVAARVGSVRLLDNVLLE